MCSELWFPLQAPKLSRAVDEGSVLCLGSRQPLGRVEELFGPVDEPLYSLRYACPTPAPADLVPGCRVFSVERLSTHVLPEAFKVHNTTCLPRYHPHLNLHT